MNLIRLWLLAWLLLAGLAGLATPAAAQTSTPVVSERVRAELLAHAPQGVAPGQPVWVGLQLQHQPQWHTYWKNSGDSGLPTELAWTLPAGVTAGEIAWPAPKKLPFGTLVNFGYDGTVLLPVPLEIGPDFRPSPFGDLELKLHATWLVCKQECIPEEGDFTLKLPVQSSTAIHAARFQAAFDARPRPLPQMEGSRLPASTATIDDGFLAITVQALPLPVRGQKLEFFPETADVIDNGAAWQQEWRGTAWTARVPLSPQRAASPQRMPVVLVAEDGSSWRADLKVQGTWPQVAAPAAMSPALQQALAAAPPPAGPSIGLLAALAGALIGGLILNLMPCVFPVLAIKVVGFTRRADDRRGHRIAGLAYTAGVLASFLALAALLLALRAAGEQLGWGFQLQSPGVVAALATLFTLIGLNLAGMFEFGSFLPGKLAALEARHPVANSFLDGVLAVAVASPCTAPFMGASLGLAVSLPEPQALAIFAMLGLGMALPYLAASWIPAVARSLPRPGPWMDTFRRLMAFPMFATVAWLVWVLGQQSGIDGAAALLALLVAGAMLVWALTLAGRARLALATVAGAILLFLAWAIGGTIVQPAPVQAAARAAGPWQDWSPDKVDALLAEGRPVFVDFTAAWCVTCQYNKKTTLARQEVLDDFANRNVALLRADWTRRDPAITAALAGLGRSGVPVYVIYRKGAAPVVLSELPGVDEIRSALANL